MLLVACLLAAGCDRHTVVKTITAKPGPRPLTYSAAQAERGHRVYLDHCVLCHGVNLSDAQFGAPLRGAYFQSRWHGRSAAELMLLTQATMPSEKPMSLSGQDYADVIAYVLQANDVAARANDLPADPEVLQEMPLPW